MRGGWFVGVGPGGALVLALLWMLVAVGVLVLVLVFVVPTALLAALLEKLGARDAAVAMVRFCEAVLRACGTVLGA